MDNKSGIIRLWENESQIDIGKAIEDDVRIIIATFDLDTEIIKDILFRNNIIMYTNVTKEDILQGLNNLSK